MVPKQTRKVFNNQKLDENFIFSVTSENDLIVAQFDAMSVNSDSTISVNSLPSISVNSHFTQTKIIKLLVKSLMAPTWQFIARWWLLDVG